MRDTKIDGGRGKARSQGLCVKVRGKNRAALLLQTEKQKLQGACVANRRPRHKEIK